jgi:hypothetical protein
MRTRRDEYRTAAENLFRDSRRSRYNKFVPPIKNARVRVLNSARSPIMKRRVSAYLAARQHVAGRKVSQPFRLPVYSAPEDQYYRVLFSEQSVYQRTTPTEHHLRPLLSTLNVQSTRPITRYRGAAQRSPFNYFKPTRSIRTPLTGVKQLVHRVRETKRSHRKTYVLIARDNKHLLSAPDTMKTHHFACTDTAGSYFYVPSDFSRMRSRRAKLRATTSARAIRLRKYLTRRTKFDIYRGHL